MSILTFSTLLLSYSIATVSAQIIPTFGKCPNVTAVPNLNTSKILGEWCEYSKYFNWFEVTDGCRTFYFSVTGEPLKLKIQIKNSKSSNADFFPVEGYMLRTAGQEHGAFVMNLPFAFPANLVVLDTDYDTYCIICYCQDVLGIFNSQIVWVLTRARQPDSALQQKVDGLVDKYGAAGVIDQTRVIKNNPKLCAD